MGYIENIQGLALFELGRMAEAIEAFTRGIASGKKTDQRRAEGLINVNKAWVLYETGDLTGALAQSMVEKTRASHAAMRAELGE